MFSPPPERSNKAIQGQSKMTKGKSMQVFSKEFGVMPIMNKLYDVMRNVSLDGFQVYLPSLVACGDQSSGKTSVLEGIVRQEFLPKGEEIQTRCPIELQLIHLSEEQESYAQVLEEDGSTWSTYEDMEDVKAAIQARTDKIKKKCPAGVTDKRIVVRICSSNVPDLTLVDLPGFLNIRMEDQDDKIIAKIEQVVRKEISNPNSIILAVSPATNNIATSRALQEALKVDPKRERTLGIITKLDLMDQGTNCEDVLRGQKLKLKLGYIGVVNRGFKDNKLKRPIEDKLEEEKKFLQENYSQIAGSHGTPFLTKTISQVLLQKIYDTLPEVQESIKKLLEKHSSRLEELGETWHSEKMKRMLLCYLEKFKNSYGAQIDGRRRMMDITKLSASARIQIIYRSLLRAHELSGGISDEQIDRAIKNSHAMHNLMAMSSTDDAFQEFARIQIVQLQEPVLECARAVHREMLDAIKTASSEMDRFPQLNELISRVTSDVINGCFKDCKDYLVKFIEAERSFVYSTEKDFMERLMEPREDEQELNRKWISTSLDTENEDDEKPKKKKDSRKKPKVNQKLENQDFEDEEDKERKKKDKAKLFGRKKTQWFSEDKDEMGKGIDGDEDFDQEELDEWAENRVIVRRKVLNYFDMVVDRVKDHIPKAVSNLLVYGVLQNLGDALMYRIYTEENVQEVLKDSPQVEEERESLAETLKKYERAKQIIDEVLQNRKIS